MPRNVIDHDVVFSCWPWLYICSTNLNVHLDFRNSRFCIGFILKFLLYSVCFDNSNFTHRANAAKEQERKAISQPNKIHRPILLKEIKFPRLSPALGRRSPVKRSPGIRSPDRRSPAPDSQAANERKSEGKERMEHWVWKTDVIIWFIRLQMYGVCCALSSVSLLSSLE